MYSTFCDNVGYKSACSSMPLHDLIDFFYAFKCWLSLKKTSLLKLSIKGVYVGDLINDTYIRFKPAPTVDLNDKYLIIIIWQTYRDLRRSQKYFKNVKPIAYLTSYTTYIQHGIAVRMALRYGVKVYSLSNFQEFAKELSIKDWFQTQNPFFYAELFNNFNDKQKKMAAAEKKLKGRLAGEVDTAVSYMKKSSYGSYSIAPLPNLNSSLVIFLHDFYDSPHTYKNMVFPDFWTWICFTIEVLTGSGIRFHLKPHPNQVKLSEVVIEKLKLKYKKLSILPIEISNRQLVDAGISCAVTVYGTVAHEMAYLGIPTITSASDPHVSFDFCKSAKNKKQYEEYLKNYNKFKFSPSLLRQQSIIFYYMHNMNFTNEQKELMVNIIKLHTLPEANLKSEFPKDILDCIFNSYAFQNFVDKIIKLSVQRS